MHDALTVEKEWIRDARQGKATGWEMIVGEYQQPIFRLAYLLLGDADDAEDVAQETFIHAYRGLGRFDAERPIRPWLMRITTNLAYNRQRSSGRYLAAIQRLLRGESLFPAHRRLAEQRLEDDSLWEAVRGLSLADQQVIYLRYFLEVPENEAADVLRVPVGTVKSRLHRALARLRSVLEKDDAGTFEEEIDVNRLR